jgi:hypothetical protein
MWRKPSFEIVDVAIDVSPGFMVNPGKPRLDPKLGSMEERWRKHECSCDYENNVEGVEQQDTDYPKRHQRDTRLLRKHPPIWIGLVRGVVTPDGHCAHAAIIS